MGRTGEHNAGVWVRRLTSRIGWTAAGFVLGCAAALVFSWFAFMPPLRESVAAREKAAAQWEELNRSEREAIHDVKNVSVEEMRGWAALVTE